jgi:putative glycosyltransferase (TIGR04348 family)
MRVLIITPRSSSIGNASAIGNASGIHSGNQVTASRWAKQIRQGGHQVQIAHEFQNQQSELLIALHARRSAISIRRWRKRLPDHPLIVALTGTDLYRDIRTHQSAQNSLALADRLVLLQPDGIHYLPQQYQKKARVIFQSAMPINRRPANSSALKQDRTFDICVIGHLRKVKDPLRTAMAVRKLPKSSRIQVMHIGAAMTESYRAAAVREMQRNPRYHWLGALTQTRTMQRLVTSRLLALTSTMEGGANVIIEAIMAGVPVISSRMSGSIGLLGEDYPGFFPVGDTLALRDLMLEVETDSRFYQRLVKKCHSLQARFQPAREQACWMKLLQEFC